MLSSPLSYSPEQTRYEQARIVAAAKGLFLQQGLEAVAPAATRSKKLFELNLGHARRSRVG